MTPFDASDAVPLSYDSPMNDRAAGTPQARKVNSFSNPLAIAAGLFLG
jgi:hypothetical protein